MCMFYTYVIFIRFCAPFYRRAGSEPLTMQSFTISLFSSMVPASLVMVVVFFGVLHCWMNAWAELTRFADREFYSDWWNAKSFSTYYRKWNGVVHDWLHAYLYVDLARLFEKRFGLHAAKYISAFLVIEISAVIHELIIFCALGRFYPVLLFMFGGPGSMDIC